MDRKRPDIPRDLAQSVMRCLEKDPERRWPTADALRRALETGTFIAASAAHVDPRRRGGRATRPPAAAWTTTALPQRSRSRSVRVTAGVALDVGAGRAAARAERAALRAARHGARQEAGGRGGARRDGEGLRRTADGRAVPAQARQLRVRQRDADPDQPGANGFHSPWSLSVAAIWGFFVAKDYARLWTAGYSWRDVIYRPPAPDAIEAKARGGAIGALPGSPAEFGRRAGAIEQARKDRAAILAMVERMSKSERKMLPDILPTVDQLLRTRDRPRAHPRRARPGHRRTTRSTRSTRGSPRCGEEPRSTDRERRISLLERQRQTVAELSRAPGGPRRRSSNRACWRCRTCASICCGCVPRAYRRRSATSRRRPSRPGRCRSTWTPPSAPPARSAA